MIRRPLALFGSLAIASAIVMAASTASATPQLRTTADRSRMETRQYVDITLSVMVDDDSDKVTACKLFIPGAFQGGPPRVGQSTMVTLLGGQLVRQSGVNCTWELQATTTGTFTLSAPTVNVNGVVMKGQPITIVVGPPGSTPAPFDPFSALLRNMQRDVEEPEPEVQVPVDPKFALETAPDTLAFLHATIDKANAVVGQQVTLDMYLYLDASLTREPDITDLHEPGTSAFIRENLLDAQMNTENVGYAKAGTRIYAVKRVRRYALFAIATGDLVIDPMRLSVGRSGERLSEKLVVHVNEPPVTGRPPGYVVGDVGSMVALATVEPRTAPRGGAIAVTVTLTGSGNLPTTLATPTRPGVDWLTPEVRSDMKGTAGVWGGSRTFTYVVRPTKQGKLDLGSLVVPFWDPNANAYAETTAPLGEIDVTAGQGLDTDTLKVFDGLPGARSTFSAPRTTSYLADGPAFFPLLLLPTALFGFFVTGTRLRERRKKYLAAREASPDADLETKLDALDDAIRETDARKLDAATMRALESATIAHLGVNVRGLGQERVRSALADAGASKELATGTHELLEECAAARFNPGGAELDDARKRAKTARELVSQMTRRKTKR
ncbi:hypothetical protein BH09MYX1_BH09MYX1_57050 [soil metagenome]